MCKFRASSKSEKSAFHSSFQLRRAGLTITSQRSVELALLSCQGHTGSCTRQASSEEGPRILANCGTTLHISGSLPNYYRSIIANGSSKTKFTILTPRSVCRKNRTNFVCNQTLDLRASRRKSHRNEKQSITGRVTSRSSIQ